MRNKYAGHCLKCGQWVEKGEGHPERKQGKWYIRCLKCVRPDKRKTE